MPAKVLNWPCVIRMLTAVVLLNAGNLEARVVHLSGYVLNIATYTPEAYMSSQAQQRYTPEEYLALERQAAYKSEYYAGEIFAMAGASRWHNLIVANVVGELRSQLKGRPCTTYPSDMRLKTGPTGPYAYPDVTVVCGEAQFEDTQQDTLLNPTLIVEVLSESTEAYDRGGKFAHYRKLDSLLEYVLIAQAKPHIEHYVRQPDNRWLLAEVDSLHDTIHFPSIDCHLALVEVYDKVDLAVN